MAKLDVRTQKTSSKTLKLKKFKYVDILRRDLIIWFVDIMRQILKSKKHKQI